MRYQLTHYVVGMPYALKGRIVDADNRLAALKMSQDIYGFGSGAIGLDVECTLCEDRPLPNAERWSNPDAPKHAPCPRCGRMFDELSQEVPS